MPLHWFVTGSRGQLGRALTEQLRAAGAGVTTASHDELDIADAAAVKARLAELPRPIVCVNAAGFTHVDRCEREPEAAEHGNARGPASLAEACVEHDAGLVHVSTDYVFAGDAQTPYPEDAPTAPRSVYGRTKLAGEQAVLAASPRFLVVRTSWVFGAGRNFLVAILNQAALRRRGEASGPLRVVADQSGRPTYATDLAAAIVQLVEADATGLFHFANAGVATWWDLARFVLDEAGFGELQVDRITTGEIAADAPRPAWSVLGTERAEGLGVTPRPWQEAVRAYLASPDAPKLELEPTRAS
ncbi:MAG: dTDP-4-dehydrorhamnose reductase [Myxococcota bacterium]